MEDEVFTLNFYQKKTYVFHHVYNFVRVEDLGDRQENRSHRRVVMEAQAVMGNYEKKKHKREIGDGEKGEEIEFCLGSLWLIEGESWSLESQWVILCFSCLQWRYCKGIGRAHV